MKSASQILYEIAGCPAVDRVEATTGRCWLCGADIDEGVPWKRWQGAQFTDQNKCSAPESGHVCSACVWACAWSPPPGHPPPAPGKKGVNLRLFSHLHDARGYLYLNKASKPAILNWLRGPHEGEWLAAIADTGQKHLIPWTPVNPDGLPPGRGMVYFEERPLQLGDWQLVDDLIELLTQGATKAEVGSGDYSARSWGELHEHIRRFERAHGRHRGGAWFFLALWLSQRDEARWRAIHGERRARGRARKGARADDRPAARGQVRRHQGGRQPDQARRADPDAHPGRGATERERAGVVHDAEPEAPAGATVQLGLFDAG